MQKQLISVWLKLKLLWLIVDVYLSPRVTVTRQYFACQILFGEELLHILHGRELLHVIHSPCNTRQEILVAYNDSFNSSNTGGFSCF